jgi:DNA modification methylase
VCDPFSGVATTGLAALRLGPRYLGIDINSSYHDLALRRLTPLLDTNPPNGDQP